MLLNHSLTDQEKHLQQRKSQSQNHSTNLNSQIQNAKKGGNAESKLPPEVNSPGRLNAYSKAKADLEKIPFRKTTSTPRDRQSRASEERQSQPELNDSFESTGDSF